LLLFFRDKITGLFSVSGSINFQNRTPDFPRIFLLFNSSRYFALAVANGKGKKKETKKEKQQQQRALLLIVSVIGANYSV